jgi:hypothetical protein
MAQFSSRFEQFKRNLGVVKQGIIHTKFQNKRQVRNTPEKLEGAGQVKTNLSVATLRTPVTCSTNAKCNNRK